MRAVALVVVLACGGSSTAPRSPQPDPDTGSSSDAGTCAHAYGQFTVRWTTARTEELVELGFEPAAATEMIASELTSLPSRDDVGKLRGQYLAVAVFLPDAAWPAALDAAEHAIERCGEGAPRPSP